MIFNLRNPECWNIGFFVGNNDKFRDLYPWCFKSRDQSDCENKTIWLCLHTFKGFLVIVVCWTIYSLCLFINSMMISYFIYNYFRCNATCRHQFLGSGWLCHKGLSRCIYQYSAPINEEDFREAKSITRFGMQNLYLHLCTSEYFSTVNEIYSEVYWFYAKLCLVASISGILRPTVNGFSVDSASNLPC